MGLQMRTVLQGLSVIFELIHAEHTVRVFAISILNESDER